MSANSRIEWTQASWNPTTGCTKVSPGCDHCYAETLHERFHGKGSFAGVTLKPDKLPLPLRWRKPRRVFVNSMSDLFHADVRDEYIAEVFAVMAAAPKHEFQVLTKRHARLRSLLSNYRWWTGVVATALEKYGRCAPTQTLEDGRCALGHAWLGVSVESQQWARNRLPALADTPAAVRWVSAEPLLEAVDLSPWLPSLGWVVVGGESGPGARPFELDWARSLVAQCRDASVPVFVKQLGSDWARANGGHSKGGDPEVWPEDLRVREYPS